MTEFEPGQVAYHNEFGFGVTYRAEAGFIRIAYSTSSGVKTTVTTNTWTVVEPMKPGHVQVKIDDLDLSLFGDRVTAAERLAEAGNAFLGQEPTNMGSVVEITDSEGKKTTYLKWSQSDSKAWLNSDAGVHCSWAEVCRGARRVVVTSNGVG